MGETDLYPPLLRYFRRNDWAFAEVPLYEKRVDVMFYSRRYGRLTAVEVKSSGWKRALQQAYVNQIVAEDSYVALPMVGARKVGQRYRANFESLGVGLIGISDVPRIIIRAKPSQVVNAISATRLRETLLAKTGEDPQTFAVLVEALSRRCRRLTLLERTDGDG